MNDIFAVLSEFCRVELNMWKEEIASECHVFLVVRVPVFLMRF